MYLVYQYEAPGGFSQTGAAWIPDSAPCPMAHAYNLSHSGGFANSVFCALGALVRPCVEVQILEKGLGMSLSGRVLA